MSYEFLEDLAIADIAFRARGSTLEAVFTAAADAVMNVMVESLDSIRPMEGRELKLENEALDMLLFDFLQDLIYYKDSEGLLLRVPSIKIRRPEGRYVLEAVALGEKLDLSRHRTRVDVKAVTLHEFYLREKDGDWEAQVVLDI